MEASIAKEILSKLTEGQAEGILWSPAQPREFESWPRLGESEPTAERVVNETQNVVPVPTDCKSVKPESCRTAEAWRPGNAALLSGSFNPIHDGHREMQRIAAELLSTTVVFELSVANADKPTLGAKELSSRGRVLKEDESLLISNCPTFEEKYRRLHVTRFVVGADTIERIGQARFYQRGETQLSEMISEFEQHSVCFVVFGRVSEGRFNSLSELTLNDRLKRLCVEIPEDQFRLDISSTKIRSARKW